MQLNFRILALERVAQRMVTPLHGHTNAWSHCTTVLEAGEISVY